jgi:hypothetical protein
MGLGPSPKKEENHGIHGTHRKRYLPYYYPSFPCFFSKKLRRVLSQVI